MRQLFENQAVFSARGISGKICSVYNACFMLKIIVENSL